jgi:hypothetical protein
MLIECIFLWFKIIHFFKAIYAFLNNDRSFPLQALSFRGEEVEPPRALPCGVSTFPLFPAGVKCLPLQSTLCYYTISISFDRQNTKWNQRTKKSRQEVPLSAHKSFYGFRFHSTNSASSCCWVSCKDPLLSMTASALLAFSFKGNWEAMREEASSRL